MTKQSVKSMSTPTVGRRTNDLRVVAIAVSGKKDCGGFLFEVGSGQANDKRTDSREGRPRGESVLFAKNDRKGVGDGDRESTMNDSGSPPYNLARHSH